MTIEQELFSWVGWDGEPECMTFYAPTLRKAIGKYPADTKFDSATILNGKNGCMLQLCNAGETKDGFAPTIVMGEYRLHYTVGKTVTES